MRGDSMTERDEDLRSVSADLADDAERLEAIEREKETLSPGDDRIIKLSVEAHELLRTMQLKGKSELALAVDAERDQRKA
jgi:hypothetical protein